MALPLDVLRDRFRATLLGCAIGDALGFPFEGAPPEAISRIPEIAEDFAPRPRGRFLKGQYTDDTQMTLAVAEAIAMEGRVDGRAIAARFVQLWKRGLILAPGKACSEAVERLIEGVPWMSAGVPIGQAGNGAAMRASPLGLWHYDDPAKIARDAELQGVITHKDPRSQAGGAAVAAAVALNLSGEPLASDVWCHRVAQVVAAIDAPFGAEIERLAQLARFDPDRAVRVISRAGFPPGMKNEWPGISPFVIPSVLMALYAFLRERDDFRACMNIVLRAGGDVDTVAAMAGAVSGSRVGLMGIPARLRKNVLDADGIQHLADRLFAQKQAQRDPAQARAGVVAVARRR